eukprot:41211-Pleurochrysis_carterae.AAC.1
MHVPVITRGTLISQSRLSKPTIYRISTQTLTRTKTLPTLPTPTHPRIPALPTPTQRARAGRRRCAPV